MLRRRLVCRTKKVSLTLLAVLAIGFPFGSLIEAGVPTCTGFNDSGAAFCEDFEDNDLDGWTIRYPAAGDINVTSPGMNGTKYAVKFGPANASNVLGAEQWSLYVPDGAKFWVEWWMAYDPNFKWDFGWWGDPKLGQGNAAYKTFELRANASGAYLGNRIMMEVWGQPESGYSRGYPKWNIYTEYDRTKEATPFAFYPNVNGFSFEPGHSPYHCVIEVTSAYGPNGRFRMWVDGVNTHDIQKVQTTNQPNGTNWSILMLGGPQMVPNTAAAWYYDQIRITRTDISPKSAAGPPEAPSGLAAKAN